MDSKSEFGGPDMAEEREQSEGSIAKQGGHVRRLFSCSVECINHIFYVELLVCIICIYMITLGSLYKRHEVLTRIRCPDSQVRKTWLGQEVRITKQEVMARIEKVWIAMHGRLSRGMSALDRDLATLLVGPVI
ncbi:hypothetical protein Q3G72_004908 [Acer saccharum]|nr:hypothetical protein Q3G72_004908 [Acer saccharum]